MSPDWWKSRRLGLVLILGVVLTAALVIIPVAILAGLDDATLNRWSQIGQALGSVGVFFSAIAFLAIALTLFFQGRALRTQQDELTVAREEQRRTSEIAIRQQHTDLIQMAIADPDLLAVWPPLGPGVTETRRDHYCNLILNLQKVAFETRTIELNELRGALEHLMTSPDMHEFWLKARAARGLITHGDAEEDFFTAEVDRAFDRVAQPPA
jgi:membrane protein implicated in regulation of membrane protease activity